MSLNTIKVPSLEQLGEVAVELGLALPEAELAAHHESLLGAFEAYSRLDRMPDELPPAHPGGRAVRHPEEHDAAGSLHGDALPRPLLRKGPEPCAPAAPRLRRGAVAL